MSQNLFNANSLEDIFCYLMAVEWHVVSKPLLSTTNRTLANLEKNSKNSYSRGEGEVVLWTHCIRHHNKNVRTLPNPERINVC